MFRRYVLVLVAVGCSQPGERQSPPIVDSTGLDRSLSCAMDGPVYLGDSSVGPLRVRSSMRSAVAVCRVLFDTIALGPEAERQRQVGFGVGRDSVLAIVESDSIWRLEVVTPHLRTTDGLGVGSPLRDLILPDATGVEADGGLYILLRKRCGLSFQMSYTPEGPEHRQDWSVAELRRLPDTTRVIRVLVVGCNR